MFEPRRHSATLRGRVISGRGTAAQIKAFTAEVMNFFGEPPVRGSLNLALDKPVRFDPKRVEFVGGGTLLSLGR